MIVHCVLLHCYLNFQYHELIMNIEIKADQLLTAVSIAGAMLLFRRWMLIAG